MLGSLSHPKAPGRLQDRKAAQTDDEHDASSGSGSDGPPEAAEANLSADGSDPRLFTMMQAMMTRLEALERTQKPPPVRATPPRTGMTSDEAMAQLRRPARTRAGTPAVSRAGPGLQAALRRAVTGSVPPNPLPPSASYDSDDPSEDGSQGADRDPMRPEGRAADVIMARVLRDHGSALNFVRNVEFKNLRNRHEARRVAQAIDAYRREGIDTSYEGTEILVRTLAGLYKSDQLGSPGILEQLEWAPPEDILPRSMLRRAIKDNKAQAKLRPTPKNTPAGAASKKDKNKGGAPAGGK